jgi:hypothetical protein
MAYFTSEDEKLRENERLYAPVAVTAAELRRAIAVGGGVVDATAVIRGLTVRIWWSGDTFLETGATPVFGWKWSVNGEGPDVWYPDVDMIFQYLADRWVAIEAEAKGVSVDPDGNSAPDLRAALDRAIALLHKAEAERDGLRVQVDQLIARNNALRDKLAWAQDRLSEVWSALRGLR